MQISETDQAEARRMLYEYEVNVRLLENKTELAKIIRETGSRAQQHHSERGGKVSGRYVDSVPKWLQDVESVEWQINQLQWEVIGIEHLLKFLRTSQRETDNAMYSIYELKYKGRVPDREVRKRFPKLRQIDEALISKVIDWQSDLLTPLLRKRAPA